MITLSKRLQAVADLVLKGQTAADIGCDHGQLAAWLVRSGTVPHAIASDVAQGPLCGARALISLEDVSSIDVRLGNGLSTLRAGEASTIIIAGMGGGLCMRLLQATPEVASSSARWVLQPNTQWQDVRRWIARTSRTLEDETLCEDGKRFYWTAAVSPRHSDRVWSEADVLLGPLLRSRKGPIFERWVALEHARKQRLAERLDGTLGTHHSRVRALRRECHALEDEIA